LFILEYFLNLCFYFHAWAQFGRGHGGRVPSLFSLSFVFGEVSKIKVMFVTFCVKSFSSWIVGHTKPCWCWNRVWCGITDSTSL